MEVGTRRIVHFDATAHPTADWTLQQFREVITGEKPYRFLIHDRDSIYSSELDSALKAMGLGILRTPFRAPQAKAYASHCTSSARCVTTTLTAALFDNLTPWAFRGGLSPGCS